MVCGPERGLMVEWAPHAPIPDFDTGPCLRFPRAGPVPSHEIYVSGLAQAIQRYGGKIYGTSHAQQLYDGPPPAVQMAHGPVVQADAVVSQPTHRSLKRTVFIPLMPDTGLMPLRAAFHEASSHMLSTGTHPIRTIMCGCRKPKMTAHLSC